MQQDSSEKVISSKEIKEVLDTLIGQPVLKVNVILGSLINVHFGKPEYYVRDTKDGEVEIEVGEYCIYSGGGWEVISSNTGEVVIDWKEDTQLIRKFFNNTQLGLVKLLQLSTAKKTFYIEFSSELTLVLLELDYGKSGKKWFNFSNGFLLPFYIWNGEAFTKEKSHLPK